MLHVNVKGAYKFVAICLRFALKLHGCETSGKGLSLRFGTRKRPQRNQCGKTWSTEHRNNKISSAYCFVLQQVV